MTHASLTVTRNAHLNQILVVLVAGTRADSYGVHQQGIVAKKSDNFIHLVMLVQGNDHLVLAECLGHLEGADGIHAAKPQKQGDTLN